MELNLMQSVFMKSVFMESVVNEPSKNDLVQRASSELCADETSIFSRKTRTIPQTEEDTLMESTCAKDSILSFESDLVPVPEEGIDELDTQQVAYSLLRRHIKKNTDDTLKDIEDLIKYDSSLIVSTQYYSPISDVAGRANARIFQLILDNQVQIPQDVFSDKALYKACIHGPRDQRVWRCTQLIKKGWTFNAGLQNGHRTPLDEIAQSGINFSFIFKHFPEEIEMSFLSKHPMGFFGSVLLGNNKDMIRFMMTQLDFNPKFTNNKNTSYVSYACLLGLLDIACELLTRYPGAATLRSSEYGTLIQTITNHPRTADYKDLSVTDYKNFLIALSENGINIHDMVHELTPIQMSVLRSNAPCTQALIELGADLTVRKDSLNLLQLAVKELNTSYLDLRLESIIQTLKILIVHFTDLEFNTGTDSHLSARAQIKHHQKSRSILKTLGFLQPRHAKLKAKGKIRNILTKTRKVNPSRFKARITKEQAREARRVKRVSRVRLELLAILNAQD